MDRLKYDDSRWKQRAENLGKEDLMALAVDRMHLEASEERRRLTKQEINLIFAIKSLFREAGATDRRVNARNKF